MAGCFMFSQGNLQMFNLNLLDVYVDISYCLSAANAFYFHG